MTFLALYNALPVRSTFDFLSKSSVFTSIHSSSFPLPPLPNIGHPTPELPLNSICHINYPRPPHTTLYLFHFIFCLSLLLFSWTYIPFTYLLPFFLVFLNIFPRHIIISIHYYFVHYFSFFFRVCEFLGSISGQYFIGPFFLFF